MSQAAWRRIHPAVLVAAGILFSAALVGQSVESPAQREANSPAQFFGMDKLVDVHITVTRDDWAVMKPEGKSYGRKRFPYVKARVRIAGQKELVVGLRFKGQSTYWKMPRQKPKKSFKIDFDRFVKGQMFLGSLKKLSLNNNHYDGSQLREAISYRAYRDAKVPAARTAFAQVHLRIEGGSKAKPRDEYLGLYTIIEQQDRGFLERWTGSKGALLKPEWKVLPYFGAKWNDSYKDAYMPRTKVSPKNGQVIADLARLFDEYHEGFGDATARASNQEDFQARLAKVLDVDEFLRYVAVTVLIGNGDSPLYLPHNYFLAIPDKDRRVRWLPWDLNNSIGGMGKFPIARFTELSIYEPSHMLFLVRVLEVQSYKERYTKIVRELIEGPCSAANLTKIYETAQKTIAAAIAREKPSKQNMGPRDLAQFFREREKSVLDQLAGRSKGVRPRSRKKGARGKGKGKSLGTLAEVEAYVRGVEKTLNEMLRTGKLTDEQFESKMRGLRKMLADKKGSPGKAKKKKK